MDKDGSRKIIAIEMQDEEKSIIEVAIGHLAQKAEHDDPKAAEDLRSLMHNVKDDKALQPMDWYTVWLVLDNISAIEFPSQSYDENKAVKSAKNRISDAVDKIPE